MKNAPKPVVTRFAPSPTGELHLGHIYSALYARREADRHHGQMRLRIDDIDFTRCNAEYTDAIYDDLAFMNIAFDGDVLVQSTRSARYKDALTHLKDRDLIYPCNLTRRALNALLSAPHGAHQIIRNTDQWTEAQSGDDNHSAWRLRMDHISRSIPTLTYTEQGQDETPRVISIDLDQLDDVVIARKDIGTSYHLAVVLDDHDTGVTTVTRGQDLQDATPIHRVLQYLLGLEETHWAHHRLITNDDGHRLAKRDSSTSIRQLRKNGLTADDIKSLLKD